MISERRKAHNANEVQRVLREKRIELTEHFEILRKEVDKTILCLQNSSLDSLVRGLFRVFDHSHSSCIQDTEITGLASKEGDLSKFLYLVQSYTTLNGSVHYYQKENSLVIALPLLSFTETKQQTQSLDLNANNLTAKNLEILHSPPASTRSTADTTESEKQNSLVTFDQKEDRILEKSKMKIEEGEDICIKNQEDSAPYHPKLGIRKLINLSGRLSADLW